MPTETHQEGIDRRKLLKRAAAAGVVAWTAPAIQTLNMTEALAFVGSQGEPCYTVRIESNGSCSTPDFGNPSSNLKCLYNYDADVISNDTTGGCESLTILKTGTGTNVVWYVTLAEGCYLIAAFARSGNDCVPAKTQGGIEAQKGDVGTFVFDAQPVSLIEMTFCCKPV